MLNFNCLRSPASLWYHGIQQPRASCIVARGVSWMYWVWRSTVGHSRTTMRIGKNLYEKKSSSVRFASITLYTVLMPCWRVAVILPQQRWLPSSHFRSGVTKAQSLDDSKSTTKHNTSYACFSHLLMLQPFHKLSRMSPPCLLRNYILHWGSPGCSLSLLCENGEEKGTREKEKGVQ